MHDSSVFRYFEAIENQKKSKYRCLDSKITKVFDGEVYTLDRQLITDPSHYSAVNQKGEEFCVEFIHSNLQTLDEILARFVELNVLVEHLPGIEKRYAIEDNRFILLWKSKNYVSLGEWNLYKTDPNISRQIRNKANIYPEVIIRAAQDLISQIATARRLGTNIRNLSPENIYMEITETPLRPAWIFEDGGIDIKIDIINEKSLKSHFPLDPDIYPHDQIDLIDFWGLGICLYSALTGKITDDMPRFSTEDNRNIVECIFSENYVPGLSELIIEFLSENCNVLVAEDRLFSPLMRS